MKRMFLVFALVLASTINVVAQHADPLPSWNDGPSKRAIVNFVEAVSTPGSSGFVAPAERTATFDNDGCLWTEQPIYKQASFIADRMKALAPSYPEWRDNPLFAGVIAKGLAGLAGATEHDLAALVAASHGGMTPPEIEQITGRRPLAAFGNSVGDFEMLQWTSEAGGRRLAGIVPHTDAEREYAYGRKSSVGRLSRALDAASSENWTTIDMKTEWRVAFR